MPPKKNKGNKKAKKQSKKKKAKEEDIPTFAYTRARILQLQRSVIESYGRVYDLRVRAHHLRELNEALDEEIVTLHKDHIDYQEAMKAQTEARGAQVVAARKRLSVEVAKAERQRQEQISMIEEKMKQLEMEKLEHETKLERLRILLIDMEPLGVQKQQQKDLIKKLEADFKNLKMQQDEELNEDKALFVSVRRELDRKYNSDIAATKRAANKLIGPCLECKLNEIDQSNAVLNHQLYQVTNRQKSLTGTKTRSSMQRDCVVRDYQFWEGIDRPVQKSVGIQYTSTPTRRKSKMVPFKYSFSTVSLSDSDDS